MICMVSQISMKICRTYSFGYFVNPDKVKLIIKNNWYDEVIYLSFSGTDLISLSIDAVSIEDAISKIKLIFGEFFFNSFEPYITNIYIYD